MGRGWAERSSVMLTSLSISASPSLLPTILCMYDYSVYSPPYLLLSLFLPPLLTLSPAPAPFTGALLSDVQNESHQCALKYSGDALLVYFGMRPTPKALFYMVMPATALPENHLCFTSFSCFSVSPSCGAGRDLVEMKDNQQFVLFWGQRCIEAVL